MKICQQTGQEQLQRLKVGVDLQMPLNYLRNNEGNRKNCASILNTSYRTLALYACFIEQDLDAMRQYAYFSAKSHILRFQCRPEDGNWLFPLFEVLLSDNAELLHWYSQHVLPVYNTHQKWINRNRVGTTEFQAFQDLLAAQQKFDLLGERAEYILANPPGRTMKRFQTDNAFYMALAKGNKTEMESALQTLCSLKVAQNRNGADGIIGSEHFMSAAAFYYGKLARLAGYELDVDMPLYPAHLIAVNPLADYTRGEVDVLAELDIYQTFDGEFAPFTPKPQGEYNLDITLNSKPMEKLP